MYVECFSKASGGGGGGRYPCLTCLSMTVEGQGGGGSEGRVDCELLHDQTRKVASTGRTGPSHSCLVQPMTKTEPRKILLFEQ